MAYNKIVFDGETLLDLTGDTVEASSVLSGVKFHGKDGVQTTGSCTFDADTSDATANASNILKNQTAYVGGSKVTGSMTNNGGYKYTLASTDRSGTTWKKAIPVGYHDGSGYIQFSDTDVKPENIKQGVDIMGVTGTYSGDGVNLQSKNVTPTKAEQKVTADSGYDALSQVTVAAVPYSEQANAAGGTTVTIL